MRALSVSISWDFHLKILATGSGKIAHFHSVDELLNATHTHTHTPHHNTISIQFSSVVWLFFFCKFFLFVFIFVTNFNFPVHSLILACPQKMPKRNTFHNQYNDQHERNCVVVQFSFIKIIVYIVCARSLITKQKNTFFVMQKIISIRNSRIIENEFQEIRKKATKKRYSYIGRLGSFVSCNRK